MKKILVIEDNEDVRENISEILELANYQVVAAANGKEGVTIAQKETVDMIICDIMMPELDGYGVLHILSKSPSTARIPFIFLTAKSDKGDFRKGMTLGADDYLTKPFDDIELLDAVETRLRKGELFQKDFKKDMSGLNAFMDTAGDLAELKNLSKERKIRKYKNKNNIYLEGDLANALYFINKGKVKTYKTNTDGKDYITGLFEDGDFIGYISLLEGSNHAESAMVLEDSEICVIPKDDFIKLIYNNRDVANKFIKMLSNDLLEKEEQLLTLAYSSVRQRVAEALLMLEEKLDKDKENAISITRENLAGIVGTAIESVIRTLSDFKDEKLIEIKGKKISIINKRGLQNVIGGFSLRR
ncbi:response regulator [Flexithrix dorotheae]|uniref:response regulator n=1 Tax=Flexithrix dorotheae TaxID=70993 RepID=UPI0003770D16|nr:response regulator [Flexithrix dorotheae]